MSSSLSKKLPAAACVLLLVDTGLAQDPPLRDPMRPHSVEQASESRVHVEPPRVSAILISPMRRIALIDGQAYRVGDVLDGAEITRIDSRSVHLRRGGAELVMPLALGQRGDATH